jgi:hypothetical protein
MSVDWERNSYRKIHEENRQLSLAALLDVFIPFNLSITDGDPIILMHKESSDDPPICI